MFLCYIGIENAVIPMPAGVVKPLKQVLFKTFKTTTVVVL